MKLPLALQPLRCVRADCTLPQGGRCAREAELDPPGDPITQCPSLAREALETEAPPVKRPSVLPPASDRSIPAQDEEANPDTTSTGSDPEPWRGQHLSMSEASSLLRRSPARLLAVLGDHGAGKTCLLASFFLQLANGQRRPLRYRFASSRSLQGWRDFVDRAAQWSADSKSEIIGHTPRIDEPDAGHFLHLGLRPEDPGDNRHIDVLLTDLPGEQIARWNLAQSAANREQMPYLERADGFVIVVDAATLLGSSGPKLDSETSVLVRRVLEAAKDKPHVGLALVLSKLDRIADHLPSLPADRGNKENWGPIGKRLRQTWPALDRARASGIEVDTFATSAFPSPLWQGQPVNVVEPFAHVLACADRRVRSPRIVTAVPEGASYFQAMRRWESP